MHCAESFAHLLLMLHRINYLVQAVSLAGGGGSGREDKTRGGSVQVVHQTDQSLNLWTLGVAFVLCFRKTDGSWTKFMDTPTEQLYKQCWGGKKKQKKKKHFYFQSAIHYLKQLCADLHRQSVATIERNEMIKAVQSARVVVLVIFHKKSSKMSHFISCRSKRRDVTHFIVTCAFVHWK